MIVPAASIFFSLVVISTSERHGKPYHIPRSAVSVPTLGGFATVLLDLILYEVSAVPHGAEVGIHLLDQSALPETHEAPPAINC